MRNEMEQRSYLPFISGGAKRIKPGYYKNKRDKTYSSMYEDDQGKYVVTPAERLKLNGQSPLSEINPVTQHPPRNIFSQTNSKRQIKQDAGDYNIVPQTFDKRAESMYVAKRKQINNTTLQ